MNKEINDGGPAFGHGSNNAHCCGMSLRDYFAGQALAGMLANPDFDTGTVGYTGDAYLYADSMLTMREKGRTTSTG